MCRRSWFGRATRRGRFWVRGDLFRHSRSGPDRASGSAKDGHGLGERFEYVHLKICQRSIRPKISVKCKKLLTIGKLLYN
jgi:hypothetical protein